MWEVRGRLPVELAGRPDAAAGRAPSATRHLDVLACRRCMDYTALRSFLGSVFWAKCSPADMEGYVKPALQKNPGGGRFAKVEI